MTDATHKIGQHLRNLVVLGLSNYGAMAMSLAINAMLTRRLGAEKFGQLALLLMASQIVLLLVANWTQTGLIRFGAQEFAGAGTLSQTFWTRLWVAAPWAMLIALTLVIWQRPLAAYLSIPPWGLWIIVAYVLASFALMTVGAVFQAKNERSRYGTALFLDKTIVAALVLLGPWSDLSSPIVVLGMYAASSCAVAIWGLLLTRRSLFPIVFRADAYRQMFLFSVPLIVSSWLSLLGTSWIDLIVIKWYRPLADIGLYSLGSVLASVAQQVTIVFATLLLPQFSVMVARGELDRINALVDRVLPYWFLGTSVMFSAVLISAQWVVPLIFGQGFDRSGAVLALLMPAACAQALFTAFSPLVSALGSTWIFSGMCILTGAINVGMDLLLVPQYGIRGAAVATVFSNSTSAMIMLAFAGARLKRRLFHLALSTLPVIVAFACFLLTQGLLFYVIAIPASALTVFGLARRLRLFQGDDAVFLDNLRRAMPLIPGISFPSVRRR